MLSNDIYINHHDNVVDVGVVGFHSDVLAGNALGQHVRQKTMMLLTAENDVIALRPGTSTIALGQQK